MFLWSMKSFMCFFLPNSGGKQIPFYHREMALPDQETHHEYHQGTTTWPNKDSEKNTPRGVWIFFLKNLKIREQSRERSIACVIKRISVKGTRLMQLENVK